MTDKAGAHRKFYIRVGPKTLGPLSVAEASQACTLDESTLVCPAERDPHRRKNWSFARSFRELRASLASPSPPPIPAKAAASPASPPAPPAAGPRYWVRLGGRVRGPMNTDELLGLRQLDGFTLLCQEGRDTGQRRNWRFARAIPGVREALSGLRGPSRLERAVERFGIAVPDTPPVLLPPLPGGLAWYMGGGALAFLALMSFRPWQAAFPRRTAAVLESDAPVDPFEFLLRFPLPKCNGDIETVVGWTVPNASDGPTGRKRFRFTATRAYAGKTLEFEVDAASGQIWPLDETSRTLLDPSVPCPTPENRP
ncbi:MAG: hypothetical protein HY928_14740 [Elusimicrobia bacterium]|nr:hypothetical protein [Elusimicrobiota bacterium]